MARSAVGNSTSAGPAQAVRPAPIHRPGVSGHQRRLGPRGRIRRIVTVTDQGACVLRRRCRRVGRIDAALARLVADMAVTMRHADGVGLAAPQVGVPLRVIVADTGRGLLVLVNPLLRRGSGSAIAEEGCLSLPGVVAPVRRALRVNVEGTLLNGQPVAVRAKGFIARILQHEIDHLNGVLFLDRVRASAVRRRPLRPGERRRRVRSAARHVGANDGRTKDAPNRRRGKAATPRRPPDPWRGSELTLVPLGERSGPAPRTRRG
jgi:peptide deformylase